MSATDPDEPLRKRPSVVSKLNIIRSVFTHGKPISDISRFRQYFTYYETELVVYHSEGFKQSTGNMHVVTHANLLTVLETMRQHSQLTRAELRGKLQQLFTGADHTELDCSTDLAVRIGLMLNIRKPQQATVARSSPIIIWDDSMRLIEIIDSSFPQSTWKLNAKDSRIYPLFTAAFMVNICGLQLQWTYCLADHLSLARDWKYTSRRILRVFPFKHCLQTMLETTDWSRLQRNQEGQLIK